MVILFYMNYGKSGISVFPYCMLLLHRRVFVLCFSVYTIMQNKYVLYTLEEYKDEMRYYYYTLQASQHISPIYSAIFHAFFSIIIG